MAFLFTRFFVYRFVFVTYCGLLLLMAINSFLKYVVFVSMHSISPPCVLTFICCVFMIDLSQHNTDMADVCCSLLFHAVDVWVCQGDRFFFSSSSIVLSFFKMPIIAQTQNTIIDYYIVVRASSQHNFAFNLATIYLFFIIIHSSFDT